MSSYPFLELKKEIIVYDTPEEVKMAVKDYIKSNILEAFAKPDRENQVAIGVTGGSIPKLLADVLPLIEDIPWHHINFFMVDEKMVHVDEPESNLGEYLRLLPEEFHESLLPIELVENNHGSKTSSYDVIRTAEKYESILDWVNGQGVPSTWIGGPFTPATGPRFEMILLDLGPDGHTASLYPNTRDWRAKNIAFIVTGEKNSNAVKDILDPSSVLPASYVSPVEGKLKFLLDRDAASKLDNETLWKYTLKTRPQESQEKKVKERMKRKRKHR